MSTKPPSPDVPDNFVPYEERINLVAVTTPKALIQWACDYLGVRLTRIQREIIVTALSNRKTIIVSGNGLGKSYVMAVLIVAFMFSRAPAAVLATSGTYPKMRRTLCRPVQQLHETDHTDLHGQYKHSPPRIDIENRPETFFEAASPSDPGELEGVHSTHTLGIIEEADKAAIDEDVIDSMESLATNENDHLVAIANPPEDESDVIAELIEDDDSWTVKEYSSFDSHNVEVERGLIDDIEANDPTANPRTTPNGKIAPIVSLEQIRNNYESWNNLPWPGLQTVLRESNPDNDAFREDLDARWYRRRLGQMPPAGAARNRPFYPRHVKAAYNTDPESIGRSPSGLAMDVARKGGDSNVLMAMFDTHLHVIDDWTGKDHIEGERRVRRAINDGWGSRFAVDATPEGSGLADNIDTFYPSLVRFNAGSNAVQDDKYKSKWGEALACFGEFLQSGGSFNHPKLKEEASIAARVIDYEEKWYESREAEVLVAESKDAIESELKRSPDFLDAALMCCWSADDNTIQTRYANRWSW